LGNQPQCVKAHYVSYEYIGTTGCFSSPVLCGASLNKVILKRSA